MIQRIQTVYLLIAEILVGVLYLLPFAGITTSEGMLYRADIQGIYPESTPNPVLIQSHWPIFIVWVITLILIFATIFLYKNRKLQIRLSIIELLTSLILCGLILFEVWSGAQRLSGHLSLTVYSIFPVIASILILLANRSIKGDEKLIRSIDRIR